MIRLAVALGVVAALLLTGVLGWLVGSTRRPVLVHTQTIRQAPTNNVLYRDRLLAVYYLCADGGRYVIVDVGQQYLHAYQSGGFAADVW